MLSGDLKSSTEVVCQLAVDKSYNIFDGEKMGKKFNGQKTAKLGTEKKPAVVNIQTEERLKEVASIFEEKG